MGQLALCFLLFVPESICSETDTGIEESDHLSIGYRCIS